MCVSVLGGVTAALSHTHCKIINPSDRTGANERMRTEEKTEGGQNEEAVTKTERKEGQNVVSEKERVREETKDVLTEEHVLLQDRFL